MRLTCFFFFLFWNSAVLAQTITVQRGDTLFSLSEKYLGKGAYWKILWDQNKDLVSSPYHMKIGIQLVLPEKNTLDEDDPREMASHYSKDIYDQPRKNEWEQLPRQPWEFDPYGDVDISHLVVKVLPLQILESQHFQQNFLKSFILDDPAPLVGRLKKEVGLEQSATLTQIVSLKMEPDFQEKGNKLYSVVKKPFKITLGDLKDAHQKIGYWYEIDGVVQLLEGKGEDRTAKVVYAQSNISFQNSFLVPLYSVQKEVPSSESPRKVLAHMVYDPEKNISLLSQFSQVALDRGVDDGVFVGSVFCAIWGQVEEKEMDTVCFSQKKIATLKVTYVSKNFSLADVVSGNTALLRETVFVQTHITKKAAPEFQRMRSEIAVPNGKAIVSSEVKKSETGAKKTEAAGSSEPKGLMDSLTSALSSGALSKENKELLEDSP